MNSEHPLAKAIVEYAKNCWQDEDNHIWPKAFDFESITGHGVKAVVRGREILVGNRSMMLGHNVDIPSNAQQKLTEAEELAQTGILVSIDRELHGILAVSDPLKPEARQAISILKSMKINTIIMTGDNLGTANAIAKEVGIDVVVAEAKPEDKAHRVKQLQVKYLFSFLQTLIINFLRNFACGKIIVF